MDELTTEQGTSLPTVQRGELDLTIEELRDIAQDVLYQCDPPGAGSSGFWSSYWTGSSCSCSCDCSCSCSCSCDA